MLVISAPSQRKSACPAGIAQHEDREEHLESEAPSDDPPPDP